MRFIHLADVNLGAVPDKGCPWSSRRKEEIHETFRRVIANIQAHPVDFLFIAGKIFYRPPQKEELEAVNQLFAQIPDTKVFIRKESQGKQNLNPYDSFCWADNVSFYSEKDAQTNVDLWKYQQGIRLHPMKGEAEKALEPIAKTDLGAHGYLEGWTQEEQLFTRFVPVAARSYHRLAIHLNTASTHKQLENSLAREIENRGRENIYRIVLQGERNPQMLLIPEKLKLLGNILEIQDESVPAYDLAFLAKKYQGTLIGEYVNSYLEQPMRSKAEEKALYYGLQALLETSRHQEQS